MSNTTQNIKSQRENPRERLSNETKLEITRLVIEEKKSTKEVSLMYGLNQTTIPKIIKSVTKSPMRKYAGDITYFDKIDTRLKAYFLGWITSDGCIVDNSNTSGTDTLAINIHEKDSCILEKFREELNRETPLYKDVAKCQVIIRINSQYICDSLRQYGLGYRKSLTMPNIFSKIPNQFHGAFVQGYFEGDGWISPCKTPYKPTGNISKTCTIGFCGTREFLHGIAEAVELKRYAIHHQQGTSENSTNGIFILTFASIAEVQRIFKFMYSDSTFWLDRKYSKFLPYVQSTLAKS